MAKLSLKFKSRATTTLVKPSSLETQLQQLMQSKNGVRPTRAEIKQLKRVHKQAEKAYRKALKQQQKVYVAPKIGAATKLKAKRRGSCTAIADAGNAANFTTPTSAPATPPPLPDGYVIATAEELAAMNPLYGSKKK